MRGSACVCACAWWMVQAESTLPGNPSKHRLPIRSVSARAGATGRDVSPQRWGRVRLREQKSATRNVAAWVLVQQAEKARKDADSLVRSGDVEGSGRQFAKADSLLVGAEAADQPWVEPVLLRGWIAYRRSRVAENASRASTWIDAGLGHANRALEREPRNARALELQGP